MRVLELEEAQPRSEKEVTENNNSDLVIESRQADSTENQELNAD